MNECASAVLRHFGAIEALCIRLLRVITTHSFLDSRKRQIKPRLRRIRDAEASDEKRQKKISVLNILRRPHNLQLPPQANTNHGAKRKQDTKRNAQTPDTLQLETGRL